MSPVGGIALFCSYDTAGCKGAAQLEFCPANLRTTIRFVSEITSLNIRAAMSKTELVSYRTWILKKGRVLELRAVVTAFLMDCFAPGPLDSVLTARLVQTSLHPVILGLRQKTKGTHISAQTINIPAGGDFVAAAIPAQCQNNRSKCHDRWSD